MRLSRFAARVSKESSKADVGFAEALFFDVRPPEDEDAKVIAEQRVAGLHHVPLLLGLAHVLCASAIVFHVGGHIGQLSTPRIILPLAAMLLCDGAACALLWLRDRIEVASNTLTLAVCALIGTTGAMWSLFLRAAVDLPDMTGNALLRLLIGAAVTSAAVVSITSPPLAVGANS